MAEADTTPRSKDRSVTPIEVQIRPCYAKAKVDPTFDIQTSKVEYSFKDTEMYNFTWVICRDIGGSMDSQAVPSWAG